MDDWMNEWNHERTYGLMNSWNNQCMTEWKNNCMKSWINEWMNGMNEMNREWNNAWINEIL